MADHNGLQLVQGQGSGRSLAAIICTVVGGSLWTAVQNGAAARWLPNEQQWTAQGDAHPGTPSGVPWTGATAADPSLQLARIPRPRHSSAAAPAQARTATWDSFSASQMAAATAASASATAAGWTTMPGTCTCPIAPVSPPGSLSAEQLEIAEAVLHAMLPLEFANILSGLLSASQSMGSGSPLSRWTAWALSAATTLAVQRLLQLSWQRARHLRILGWHREPPLELPQAQATGPVQPVLDELPQTPVRRASASWHTPMPEAMYHDAYTQTITTAGSDTVQPRPSAATIPPLPLPRVVTHEASTCIDVQHLLPLLPSGSRAVPDLWTVRDLGRRYGLQGLQFVAQQSGLSEQEVQQLYIEACMHLQTSRICHNA